VKFDDVLRAYDVADFNLRVRMYFRERPKLCQKEKSSHYWALFYAWKETFRMSGKTSQEGIDANNSVSPERE